MFERFEHLWEKPFESNRAAVARQERFLPFPRDGVDAIGLRLRAMMFPKFRPRQSFARELLHKAQRRAVAQGGQHRTARKIHADAQHFIPAPTGHPQCRAHGLRGGVDPVLRMLQCIVRRQFFARAGQRLDDLPVCIARHRGADFPAAKIDEQRAHGFRAEVETEGGARVHISERVVIVKRSACHPERSVTKSRDLGGSIAYGA